MDGVTRLLRGLAVYMHIVISETACRWHLSLMLAPAAVTQRRHDSIFHFVRRLLSWLFPACAACMRERSAPAAARLRAVAKRNSGDAHLLSLCWGSIIGLIVPISGNVFVTEKQNPIYLPKLWHEFIFPL